MATYCKNAKRLEILYEAKSIKGNDCHDCKQSVYNTANFHHFWNFAPEAASVKLSVEMLKMLEHIQDII